MIRLWWEMLWILRWWIAAMVVVWVVHRIVML